MKTTNNFKPILFSTPMVQAILRGEKTQTRRKIKHKNIIEEIRPVMKCIENENDWNKYILTDEFGEDFLIKPKYKVGDILWVRETFQILPPNMVFYKADLENKNTGDWKPSIFMPKSACRLFLKLKDIRVERLNNISESDSLQEGIQPFTKDNNLFKYGLDGWEWQSMPKYARDAYKTLWQKINGEKSWEENPFVWVYEFERTDESFACS